MPHLLFEWLVRRARARWPGRGVAVVPVPDSLGTPYDRAVEDGTRYVSFADWICPTHCIEPATCPAIGAPRTWEMGDAARSRTLRRGAAGAGARAVRSRHETRCRGDPIAAVLAGIGCVEAGSEPAGAEVLVGTISSCHGALNVITIAGERPVDGRWQGQIAGGPRHVRRFVVCHLPSAICGRGNWRCCGRLEAW
jgi:hypothetical protein